MNPTLDLIRTKIAELETKIANLRIAEHELLTLETAVIPKEKTVARPRASTATHVAVTPAAAPQTIASAITEVLKAHGALTVAGIAEQIKAGGREIDRRRISFSLQALKKQGFAKRANGNWTLTKASDKRVSKARPKAKLPAARTSSQVVASSTVRDLISRALTESGPLPLAELVSNIRASGKKVANRTLSNTLQKMKTQGAVKSVNGKWGLSEAG
ncbi:MAG TPA: hypothetical protein VME69_10445 [Methylocella sp.]|nr:hypothetical protein [Methylocella sp.]